MDTMLKVYLLSVILGMASALNSYVIMSPSIIRPNMDFEISVNIIRATRDVSITATIKTSQQSITSAKSVFFQGHPKGLALKIPADLKYETYILEVSGSGGLTFQNQTKLLYKSKSKSIFIQTDKALYKPGQTINFRVFAIYPTMKIYTGAYNIEIYDPNRNKIKQWSNATDASGVITNFLVMTTQPVLGDWKIMVTTNDGSEEKVFTVGEYVLPKFEVSVELPPYAVASDNFIIAKVSARYTYGRPVKGEAKIFAVPQTKYYEHLNDPIVHHTLKIDGETKFIIFMKELKSLYPQGLVDRDVQVTANVTDEVTSITLAGSSHMHIYKYSTKLSFSPSNPTSFKPGLRYIAYLHVEQQDGRPVQHNIEKVKVSITAAAEIKPKTTSAYYYPQTMAFSLGDEMFVVDNTGVVSIDIHTPSNATRISLHVSYGHQSLSKTIYKGDSPSDNYLQLLLNNTQSTSIGQNVNIDVFATEPVSILAYQVISHGTIVTTGFTNIGNKNTSNINIKVTSLMAPSARIVSYYVRQDFEIVADSLSFDVDGAFENKVSISMDKNSAKPGEGVNIQVTADPQSLVNLLAVDQSVLLLKSGNDITQSQVIDKLETYGTSQKDECNFCKGYPLYYGSLDTSLVFESVGVVVMTDYQPKVDVPFTANPWLKPPTALPVIMTALPTAMPGIMTALPTAMPGIMPNMQPTPYQGRLKGVERIRSRFPETWMWMNKTVGANGKAVFSTTVPDTITSWVASAFAVNSLTGLGVAPTISKVKVFKPFFVSLNLPYSVTRGEQVALQAIVFNYLTQDVDTMVSLPQSSEYQNVINRNGSEQTESTTVLKAIQVRAGETTSVSFPIVPTRVGKIDITVTARSSLAADSVRRQLLVEHEGTPKEYNIPFVIDVTKGNIFHKQAQITLPRNVVTESLVSKVTAIGDLMGPSVSGLDNLLRMPTGCGEQTMLGFAPDVFVTNYLSASKQLAENIRDKAIDFMEKGYQRELTYQHPDGSFSAFGTRDRSGSMWLTAFVIKTFHEAKPYIFIDDGILTNGIDWMLLRQSSDGQFPEPGNIVHTAMTGGSGKGAALTAFVLIALLENQSLKGGIQQRISQAASKAVKYLESHPPTDDYSLAIVTYALQLAGSPFADTYFATLNSHAIVKDGLKYWHIPDTKTVQSNKFWSPPHSSKAIDIEMTSYILLTYHKKNDFIGGLDIMKWLFSQRNPYGGFSSTQDTILALQSLSQFPPVVDSNNFDVQVTVSAINFNHNFSINQKNALVLQSVQLPSVPKSIEVDATGRGIALVQVGVFFFVDDEVEEAAFNLTWKILKEDISSIALQTCASWLGADTSGMAVEEVGLPSGFQVDTDNLKHMQTLRKIETENKKAVLYFDKIGSTPICVTLNFIRTEFVAKSKPVPIKVYDYYEPTNQKTVFYESNVLKNTNICSMCTACEGCQ